MVVYIFLSLSPLTHRAQGSLKSLQVLLECDRVDVARQTRTKQTTLVLATTQVFTAQTYYRRQCPDVLVVA